MGRRRGAVVITGASYGAGRAAARLFASKGFDVGLIARGEEGLQAARREVEAQGARACVAAADVAAADQVEAAASRIECELGPIEIWVNNAMVSVFCPVKEMRPDEIRRVTEVTYLGAVYGTMAALKRMLPRGRGVIVQAGSALAYRGIPLQAAYSAAKHAVQGFSESLRSELLHDGAGVKVVMVQLPALNTPHFSVVRSRMPRHPQPVPPIFQPEVAAKALFEAAMRRPREVNIGFKASLAVVANSFFPGLLDRFLARAGYHSQQMARRPAEPGRRDNLWEPPAGDLGAHGIFDSRSNSSSRHLWYAFHRKSVALIIAAGLAARALRRHD